MNCCDFTKNANDRIVIREQTLTSDDYGGQSTTWTTVTTVWAWIKPIYVYEWFRDGQLQSQGNWHMIIRYNSLFKDTKDFAANSITFDGRVYNIIGVENLDESLKNYGTEYQRILVMDNGPEIEE